jgi:hypothetical protein
MATTSRLIAIALGFAAIGIGATTAYATSSRADYVAQADPICKNGDDQIAKRIPGLIKRIGRQSRITPTIAFAYGLGLGGKIFARETGQIAVIAPPPGDEAAVSGWVAGRRTYKRMLDRAVAAGKHNKKKQMLRRFKQAVSAVGQANQLVAAFGFQYCVITQDA